MNELKKMYWIFYNKSYEKSFQTDVPPIDFILHADIQFLMIGQLV